MPVVEQDPVLSILGQGPPAGTPIRSFLLTDSTSPGMSCQVITLGATLTHLWVPDLFYVSSSPPAQDSRNEKNGLRDVVLGFDDLTVYRSHLDPYFGATVGRIANRIAQGQFSLPDEPNVNYTLDQNNKPNSLHGGLVGFSSRMWQVEQQVQTEQGASIRMSLLSEHLDQGFPGELQVYCTYRLLEYRLEITYEAFLVASPESAVPARTIVSLTNHAYFNLDGVLSSPTGDCLDHIMEMPGAVSFLETDSTSIPTGNVIPLDSFPAMDFRTPKAIGRDIALIPGGGEGYDHFFPLGETVRDPFVQSIGPPVTAARVYSPKSGIQMTMSTTEPGFQLYTANFVQVPPSVVDQPETPLGRTPARPAHKAQHGFGPHSAFCLEASRFPDAIHHDQWASQVVLKLGDRYTSKTVFEFSTRCVD